MGDAYAPTIKPIYPFDALEDAKALRKAMKGFGTDEDAIIEVLTKRCGGQRSDILTAYKNEFGRDLIKDLKSELGGKFEDLVLALMDPPFEYLAGQLHKAMDKIGTNEDVLTEILCTRGNAEINQINQAYAHLYGKSLEDDISSEVSGDYKRLLVMLLTCSRNEHVVEPERATEMAESLYDAGEGKLGTDEEAFTTLLAHQSFYQLKLVFDEYANISGKTIQQAVESELGGELKEAILTIARRTESAPRYFAEQLKAAMKGAGTADSTLIRIIVSRSEIDLEAIKKEYMALYHKTLESAVKDETGGDYEKALISIIEGN
jgi:annexin A7/11